MIRNLLQPEFAGFEGGSLGGWTVMAGTATLANSTDQSHSGTHSLLMTATSATPALNLDTRIPPGNAGKSITVSAWVYVTRSRSVQLFINWYDANNILINGVSGWDVNIPVNTWVQMVRGPFTVPANAVWFRLVFNDGQGQSGDVAYLDEFSILADWSPLGMWIDPQGNMWTIENSTNVAWIPGGVQLNSNGNRLIRGPTGMAPRINGEGFDVRLSAQMVGAGNYMAWVIGDTVTNLDIRPGIPVNGTLFGLANQASSLALYVVLPNSAFPTPPVAGDMVTARCTYNQTTGTWVTYYSLDNGTSWVQAGTGTITPFPPGGNAASQLQTYLYGGILQWFDLRTFAGVPLASVDFTHQWDTTGIYGIVPASQTELTPTRPIVISGWGLANVTDVLIDRFSSTDIVYTPSTGIGIPETITFTPPVMAVGVYNVTLVTPDGNIPAGTFRYNVIPPVGPDDVEEGPFGIPFHQGRCLVLANLDDSQIPYEISNILDLMDHDANGIICDTVDLGYPDVREDTGVWTDADGTWDFTRFFGARGITLSGTLVDSARGSRSMSFQALVPFLSPAARPILVYSFNADMHFAYMKIRAQGYSGPITNPIITRWSGQWKCPDAISYDLDVQTVTIIPGITGSFGRVYTDPQETGIITATSGWAPNRYYPSMGGSAIGLATNAGTALSFPIIQIFGGCTGPIIRNDTTGQQFAMLSNYVINPGEVLVIDMRQKAVYLGTPNASRYNQVDFSKSTFWSLAPGDNHLTFDPSVADDHAQAIITWQNAYI